MNRFVVLNLSGYLNNRGLTETGVDEHLGFLSIGGASLPREQVPLHEGMEFHGVPFTFASGEQGDNVEFAGQTLEVEPSTRVRKVHVLGVSSNGSFFDDVHFNHQGATVKTVRLALSNHFEPVPNFPQNKSALEFTHLNTRMGRQDLYKPQLWYSCLDLGEEIVCDAIGLEDNPSMHVFAITFERGEDE